MAYKFTRTLVLGSEDFSDLTTHFSVDSGDGTPTFSHAEEGEHIYTRPALLLLIGAPAFARHLEETREWWEEEGLESWWTDVLAQEAEYRREERDAE